MRTNQSFGYMGHMHETLSTSTKFNPDWVISIQSLDLLEIDAHGANAAMLLSSTKKRQLIVPKLVSNNHLEGLTSLL